MIALYARNTQLCLLIWVLSAVSVAIALSAAFLGALLGFSGITFRVFQIGVTLFGPVLAAWGAVEFACGSARVRFGSRLVVATLTIVPLVILSVDRLGGQYGSGFPAMSEHYDVIPVYVLGLVHTVVVGTLLGCLIAVLSGGRARPRLAGHQATVLGLIGLAVLLEIIVGRFGLSFLGQLLIVGAVVSLWVACVKVQSPPRDASPRGRRAGRRDGFDDPDDDFDDEPDDGRFGMEDDVPRRRRSAAGGFDGDGAVPPERATRLRGIITIYTIVEGHQDIFDDLAEEVVAEVTKREPDTLLFACHTVSSAPLQRIIYAIYRDQLAFEEHQQQPHIVEFARKTHGRVAATNVIELALAGASASDNLAALLMSR
ncbi:quinol monooxygenase YgiN [Lipingzhangella halophila]|uniref:Quinol monooxygenase YgiN n=1 Tax=Lipingzhangella halophila TaxID=1783352 RepID=A0A7W7RLH8_9ACTN|nr:antibiotic biosynthesis monooxygenase [Lipingzhangella halophila]MBB4934161.1 quinol monooxygenase YgiN [Lipingzhangella halophila]